MPGLIERYRDRLPFADGDPVVSLGEGSTPHVLAERLSERTGAEVWLKIEGANPTGSFKDRGMTCAVSAAVREGAEALVCASTGNTAASAASVAGLLKHGTRGAERVVCVLTGHGLKDPQTALAHAGSVVACEPDLAAVEQAVLA